MLTANMKDFRLLNTAEENIKAASRKSIIIIEDVVNLIFLKL